MILQDKYINLLTDFGFKRVFGTEPNKRLLIDFLNTLLPIHHQIRDLTFRNTENLGSTAIDRKAIFDIYCQAKSGERFIVEIQKAKHNFFKDRSIYYSTFPIQEQALKGDWDYQLSAVYTVGILDFIFDDHKEDPDFFHIIELKNQRCEVFYDKLKYIYIELPKFKKTLEELETHFDKWMYLLKHLADLTDRPTVLQEEIFNELFETAEIANFTRNDQEVYENSLKYYRDWYSVSTSLKEEGRLEERSQNLARQRSLLVRLLPRTVGELSDTIKAQINQLSVEQLELLNELFWDFTTINDLIDWLNYIEPI
jgi:predicted transposase/invertase (TIGR01784 family)